MDLMMRELHRSLIKLWIMLAVLHNLKMPLRLKDCQIHNIHKNLYQARYQNFLEGGGRGALKRKFCLDWMFVKNMFVQKHKNQIFNSSLSLFLLPFLLCFFFWLCFITSGLTFNIQSIIFSLAISVFRISFSMAWLNLVRMLPLWEELTRYKA